MACVDGIPKEFMGAVVPEHTLDAHHPEVNHRPPGESAPWRYVVDWTMYDQNNSLARRFVDDISKGHTVMVRGKVQRVKVSDDGGTATPVEGGEVFTCIGPLDEWSVNYQFTAKRCETSLWVKSEEAWYELRRNRELEEYKVCAEHLYSRMVAVEVVLGVLVTKENAKYLDYKNVLALVQARAPKLTEAVLLMHAPFILQQAQGHSQAAESMFLKELDEKTKAIRRGRRVQVDLPKNRHHLQAFLGRPLLSCPAPVQYRAELEHRRLKERELERQRQLQRQEVARVRRAIAHPPSHPARRASRPTPKKNQERSPGTTEAAAASSRQPPPQPERLVGAMRPPSWTKTRYSPYGVVIAQRTDSSKSLRGYKDYVCPVCNLDMSVLSTDELVEHLTQHQTELVAKLPEHVIQGLQTRSRMYRHRVTNTLEQFQGPQQLAVRSKPQAWPSFGSHLALEKATD